MYVILSWSAKQIVYPFTKEYVDILFTFVCLPKRKRVEKSTWFKCSVVKLTNYDGRKRSGKKNTLFQIRSFFLNVR